MALYKYFKKALSALPNRNGSFLGCMPSKAISSANCKMLGLVHQDIGQNSKTINTTQGECTTFSATESLSILSLINPYSDAWVPCVGRGRLFMKVWVLRHLSPSLPLHTAFTNLFFANTKLPMICKINSQRNLSVSRYVVAFAVWVWTYG